MTIRVVAFVVVDLRQVPDLLTARVRRKLGNGQFGRTKVSRNTARVRDVDETTHFNSFQYISTDFLIKKSGNE